MRRLVDGDEQHAAVKSVVEAVIAAMHQYDTTGAQWFHINNRLVADGFRIVGIGREDE
jgi:hypothetical protein